MKPVINTAGNNLLCRAIRERKLVQFSYHKHSRIVEPHVYGIDTKGQEILRAYQVKGGSDPDETSRWKTFLFSEVVHMKILQNSFSSTRPEYTKDDKELATIYSQL